MNNFIRLNKMMNIYRKQQVFVTLLSLIMSVLALAVPYLIKILIDSILNGDKYSYVIKVAVIIMLVTITRTIIGVIQNYNWHILRRKSIKHLRYKMFSQMIKKEIKYFKLCPSGEILTKIIQDVVIVAQSISIGIPMLISNVIRLMLLLTVMIALNIKLTILTFIVVPVYYSLFNILNKHIRTVSKEERNKFSDLNNSAQEKILGITTIKIFKKEIYFKKKFKEKLNTHFKFVKKSLFLTSTINGITTLIISLLPVIILLYGSKQVLQNKLTVGSLIAFYTYLSYIYEPINNLSDYYMGLQTTLGMSDRILDFIENDLEEQEKNNKTIKQIESISFKNVSFSYNEDEEVISNFNLDINKGDKVAIIGTSGKGKTTITSLLMKIYDNYSGVIIINGIDLRDISRESLYDMIVLVEQDSFIFEGTIKENIAFDYNFDSDSHIKDILDVSGVSKFTNLLNNKLKYKVSEFGNNLSGGQKQRICISRALSHDFDVLILDEATSALDYGLEKEIIDKLNNYLSINNKTLITISHRPEILSICDKIINLDKRQEFAK